MSQALWCRSVPGLRDFSPAIVVMGLVNRAYAEFLVAKPEDLTNIPEGLNTEDAAALPLVVLTGSQLIEDGVQPKPGQTVLVTGAVGSVGRTAVFVAKQHGMKVIAGVKASQRKEAETLGAAQVVALDDDQAIASLGQVDAIADTVGHDVIQKLMPHIRAERSARYSGWRASRFARKRFPSAASLGSSRFEAPA